MKPRTRRLLHRLFFAVLALVTLVALFYAEEDWRGAWAWNRLQRELQARGGPLESSAFIPPPVPDDQNLAMAPLFVREFRYKVDPATGLLTFDPKAYENNPTSRELNNLPYGQVTRNIDQPAQRGNWRTGHRADLRAWQTLYQGCKEFPHPPRPGAPAEDVAVALSYYDGLLDELAQAAAERPQARFPINYTQRPNSEITLPHTNTIQRLERTLRLRACARLALGQTSPALRDVELQFRLNGSLANEPTMIAALVRSSGVDLILQPVWEGLQARQWSATDLAALQTELRGVDLLRALRLGLQSERQFQAQLGEELQHWASARKIQKISPMMLTNGNTINGASRWCWFFLPALPRGWYAQNVTVTSRYIQSGLIDAVDPANGRVTPARVTTMARSLSSSPVTPYNFLASIILPVYPTIFINPAAMQTAADQAMVACALERYHLDHQTYPDRLDTLVPAYLDRVPHDVIGGAPMHYRQTMDGRYQLYSVGWDGQDDGGSIEWPANRKWRGGAVGGPPPFPNPAKDRGDWVWQYAPAEPPEPPANRSRLE